MAAKTPRVLSETEQAFAETLIRFGDTLDELVRLGKQVRAEGGDARAAAMQSVRSDDERRLLESNWPMFSVMLGI